MRIDDLYRAVTRMIIAELEVGAAPWVKPWTAEAVVMPQNAITGRPYNGINVLILWMTAQARLYPSNRWLTFKQALEKGACVRKGEKGTPIVFVKPRVIPSSDEDACATLNAYESETTSAKSSAGVRKSEVSSEVRRGALPQLQKTSSSNSSVLRGVSSEGAGTLPKTTRQNRQGLVEGKKPQPQNRSDGAVRGTVPMLPGGQGGVPDLRPHQRGRQRSSEGGGKRFGVRGVGYPEQLSGNDPSALHELQHGDHAGSGLPSSNRGGPALKVFYVFNVAQIDGLEAAEGTVEASRQPIMPFAAQTGATILHGHPTAGYVPSRDVVFMPNPETFTGEEQYQATLLHELCHWTGHETRLNRDLKHRFGSKAYAAEELVAELGAAFLCSHLGIHGQLRHAGYIASWLELLKEDEKAIFTASSKAAQAADFLRSFSEPKELAA